MAMIWVDADACPKAIKEILLRASKRTGIEITFVANHHIPIPSGYPQVKSVTVSTGFDVADDLIEEQSEPNDLVITQDIPLADAVLTKGAKVINTRGQSLTKENIKQRLNMRDFLETMRSSGVQTGGPKALGPREIQDFANVLDRWLAKIPK
ncbi:hypothetical protein A3762_07870 [Oleiphilus sp. HI0125]|uniref:YaiI/YqxD family protein n=1 Tax=Oleiphilus sp. HI0125 TaxID=1822266 RepID=UPI0007C23FDC|nr:YaiI/YqxD family protein [Oleiphilus sp. HI0125]KZZ58430.1 hypothetical protein A3762_07870 [Oleiphilus sp. HI0125]